MKKYLNYIFEGKINELKIKYKDKVPEEIFNYFVSKMSEEMTNVSSILLEVMLKYYIDNKDNKKYEKVELEKYIFELIRLFQQRKKNFEIKDIRQLKTLDSLKKILIKNHNINVWESVIYYDGEEYIIFSPVTFDAAYEYGDHIWCINREPKYFFSDEYKASKGGVIQCINKINSDKNLAFQIVNINNVYNYEDGDNDNFSLDIIIWNFNDEKIYDGYYKDFKKEPNLSKWCEENDITSIKEILYVLDKIEKKGINPFDFYEGNLEDLWYEFEPRFYVVLEWAIENEKVNELLLYIIKEGNNDIINAISDLFLISDNNINKQIAIDTLSANLNPNIYIKKYNLNINTDKKSPREIWQQIYDKVEIEKILKLMQDNEILQDYIKRLIEFKKYKPLANQLKIFENKNIEKFALYLDEETSKMYLEYLNEIVDLDTIDYRNFLSLDLYNSIEDWKTFKKMMSY